MSVSARQRIVFQILGAVAVFLLVFFATAYSQKRSAELRTREWIIQILRARFHADVELADFHVDVFPRMAIHGEGLSLHDRNRPEAPPIIRVERFAFELGFLGLFRAPRRIQTIRLQRLVITIPPKSLKATGKTLAMGDIHLPGVTVGKIECENADLLMLSKTPGKEPLDWEIHNLVLREVGSGEPFTFAGTLTNGKPKGEIETKGEFGPWDSEEPGATPVSGRYGFSHADLGPFPGIAGILSSTGTFQGPLNELEVEGKTDTPDFSLDRAGRPVPLRTDFSATVDGTNGDTLLHPVRALLGQSVIVAAGGVIKVPEKRGHQITLDVTTPKARIEDILQLAINSDQPFLRGPVNIKAKLLLGPGNEKVIDKMVLDGDFAITNGHWASTQMREKLESFSRHAEGQPADEDAGSSVTDLRGTFVLRDGVIKFSKLTFSVPGAGVELAGTYEIHSQKIDMKGELRMQAKLSQTVTGAKSFFLKAVDPFYSKNGSGTVLPLSVSGTQENPVIGVTVLHKKFEKQVASQKSN